MRFVSGANVRCVSAARNTQTGETCAVKKVTNVFTKKVGHVLCPVKLLMVDLDEAMLAGVEVIASFQRAQECKSLIIDLIRENADDRSHGRRHRLLMDLS
jgi:hypothetical protein